MSVEDIIKQAIQDSMDDCDDEIYGGSNLYEDLGLDSLATLMIINNIEDQYGVQLDEKDFTEAKTVDDILSVVKKKYPDIEQKR